MKKFRAYFEIQITSEFDFEAEDDDAAQEMMDGWEQDGSHDLINRGFMGETIEGYFTSIKPKPRKKKHTPTASVPDKEGS